MPKLRGVLAATLLESPDSITRTHYAAGATRQIARDFSFLGRAPISRIDITDRYMVAAQSNREALASFFEEIAQLWTSKPEKIVFTYGPVPNQRDRSAWKEAMNDFIRSVKRDTRFQGVDFQENLRGGERVRDFHDRRIRVTFIQPAPQARANRSRGRQQQPTAPTMVAELTGGIDVLMDRREETTIYSFEES